MLLSKSNPLRYLLIWLIFATPLFSLADIPCNPDANCSICKKIFGKRLCVENLACQTVRAVCRTKCGNINDDANRYISEDKRAIAEIDENLRQNAVQQLSVIQTLNTNSAILAEKNSSCAGLEKARTTLRDAIHLQNQFIGQIEAILENSGATINDILIAIDNNQDFAKEEKIIFADFIRTAAESTGGLKVILDQFDENNLQPFNEILAEAMVRSKLSCEAQTNNLENQDKAISAQREALFQQQLRFNQKRQDYINQINTQESRKCPSRLL